jgi:hypothetical protein
MYLMERQYSLVDTELVNEVMILTLNNINFNSQHYTFKFNINNTHTNSIDNIKKHILQNVQDQVRFTSNIFFDDVDKESNHFENLKDNDNEVYIILNSVDKYQCDPIRAELAHTEMTKKHI